MLFSVAYAAEHAAEHAHEVGFFQDPHTWVYISFVMVVAIIVKMSYGAAVKGLDAHAQGIQARFDEAHKLSEAAAATLAQQERKQHEALKEAQEMFAQAKSEVENFTQQASRDLEGTLARREQQTLDRIAQAEAQFHREMTGKAVEVAVEAARGLLAKDLSGAVASHVLDESIKDLSAKLH